MINDKMLQSAAAKSCEIYVERLDKESVGSDRHTFSLQFEKKIQKLKRKADHPLMYSFLRRAASVVLVLLLGTGAFLAINAEARAAFCHWIMERYESMLVIRKNEETSELTDKPEYSLGLVPDGYSFYTNFEQEGGTTILYSNNAGQLFWFGYIYNSDIAVHIDVSDMEQTTVNANGIVYEFFSDNTSGNPNVLIWIDEENISFRLSGFFDQDKLIEFAEHVKILK